jgi:streptogramin lyase
MRKVEGNMDPNLQIERRSNSLCVKAAVAILVWIGGSVAAGQTVTSFPIPTADSGPRGIAAGPDGNLWFTEFFEDKIGRITTAGVITEFVLPTTISGPWGIAAGPDGNLWFTELLGSKIGKITTSGKITEFELPAGCVPPHSQIPSCFPRSIAAGPDGNLWFTENGDKIGRITTAGVVTEFTLPFSFDANGIAAGPDGNLWFTASSGGGGDYKIGRITTAGVITGFEVPTANSGFGSVGWIAAGPDGNLWFTEPGANEIGRITTIGSTGPCVADSASLCLSFGRFRVQANWQIPSQGTSGQGTAVSLTGDTGTFWFFNASNVEMIVKVLDACTLNSHKWVFAGGLTNVEVTLTVTDTQTDAVKTYVNPANTAFLPIQDTVAFGTCP